MKNIDYDIFASRQAVRQQLHNAIEYSEITTARLARKNSIVTIKNRAKEVEQELAMAKSAKVVNRARVARLEEILNNIHGTLRSIQY